VSLGICRIGPSVSDLESARLSIADAAARDVWVAVNRPFRDGGDGGRSPRGVPLHHVTGTSARELGSLSEIEGLTPAGVACRAERSLVALADMLCFEAGRGAGLEHDQPRLLHRTPYNARAGRFHGLLR